MTLDDARRDDEGAAHRAGTVTMLQDAAGSGHPVMFPGTLESRPSAPAASERPAPPGGYVQEHALPASDHTGRAGRTVIWLVDRLIALLRTAPAQ